MNIEEMLDKHLSLYKQHEEALQQCRSLELEMRDVLYDNEEPFELSDAGGNYTGITLKTPGDMADIRSGCVIAIGGAEWFRVSGYWLSCYDTKRDDHEMFVRILRNREYTQLIHKAY